MKFLDFITENDSEIAFNLMYFSFNLTEQLKTNDFNVKAKYIVDFISNYNMNDRTLILNGSMEHSAIEVLISYILDKVAYPKNKIKIVLSVPTNNPKILNYDHEIIPSASANMFDYYGKLKKEQVDWINIPMSSHLIVLANNPTTERAEIIKMILSIAKNQTRASFGIDRITNMSLQYWKKIMDPYPVPMVIDKESFTDYHDINSFSIKLYQSLVNVILESLPPSNTYTDLSEKSYKPFAWHQMPLWFAPHNQVDKVRELGFDTFDDLFDGHTYNKEPNNQFYKLKLLKTIKNFINAYPTLDSITELRHKMWNRLDANEKHLAKIIANNPYYLQS